jgi:hypothetical protein
MKTETRHQISHWLTASLITALAVTITACSTPSSPTATTKTQDAAVKLVFITQPGGAEAGVFFTTQPVVAVQDSNGNIVTNFRKAASLTVAGDTGSSPVTLFGGTTNTPSNGIYNFNSLCIDQSGRYKLTATCNGLTSAVSDTFEITPGAANKLVWSTQPSGGMAGTAFTAQPVLIITDFYGNKTNSPAVEVGLSIVPGLDTKDAILSGVTKVKAVNGVVNFKGLSIQKTGLYNLMARIEGLTSVYSDYLEITPGAPVKLFFSTQPMTTTAGSPLTVIPPAIAVLMQDNYNNTVTDSTAEITIAITPNTGASGAVLSGVTKFSAVHGIVGYEGLSIDKPGQGYTLTASSNGLPSVISDRFDITPAPAPTATSSNTTTAP